MAKNAGDIVWNIGANLKGFEKAMKDASGKAGKMGKSLMKHSKQIGAGFAAAGAAVVGSMGISVKAFAEAGDEVQKMSLRTGFAVETLSELKFAAERSGASLKSMDIVSKKMSRAIFEAGEESKTAGDKQSASMEKAAQKTEKLRAKYDSLLQKYNSGNATSEQVNAAHERLSEAIDNQNNIMSGAVDASGSYTDALSSLGLNYQQLIDQSPEQQFLMIMNSLADMTNHTEKAAIAQEIFGRAGTDLLPMLENGSVGLQELRDRAQELGVVFDQESANKAAKFQDSMLDLGQSLTSIKFVIAETVIPPLLKFIDAMTETITKIREWVKANPELTQKIIMVTGVIGVLASIIAPLLIFLPGLVVAFKLLAASAGVVGTVIAALTSPIALVIAAVVALAAVIYTNWDEIKARTVDTFAAIGRFAIQAFNSLKNVVSNVVGFVIGKIRSMLGWLWDAINALAKLIGLRNKVSSGGGGGGSKRQTNADGGVIKGYAMGGVTNHGISMVGERGAELAALPVGTRVMSHPDMMRAVSRGEGGMGGGASGRSLGDIKPVFNVTINGETNPDKLMQRLKEPFSIWMRDELVAAMR